MKKGFKVAFIITMLLFMVVGVGSLSYVKASSDYQEWTSKQRVEENKVWTIRFNNDLDKTTINSNNVYVTDENGQTIPVDVALSADLKGVTVSLKNGGKYEKGKSYYLIITEKVKKTSGKPLGSPARMKFTIKSEEVTNKEFAVLLDAGHGGSDIGITGPNGNMEKDIALNIVLKAGAILERSGIKVIYTRTHDNITWNKDDMASRFSIINNEDYNYFAVSVHTNVASNNEATGAETYYLTGDALGQTLADNIQQKVETTVDMKSRGVKTSNFVEGSAVNIPIAKIFVGFLNNPQEELVISSPEMQDKFAEAIAGGIIKFKETEDLSGSGSRIVSAEDVIATVTEGDSYTLPSTVKAMTSQGDAIEAPVTWDNTFVDTTKAGTYSYTGTIAGYREKVYLTLLVTLKGDSRFVVVIDPGHGGYDPGAIGANGLKEKDVTLPVGIEVGNILLKNGVKVVYTRTSDNVSWPSEEKKDLQKRVEIGNSVNANYYVSIHCNSIKNNPSANGTETYYDSESVAGKALAQNIQSQLVSNIGTTDRKIKTAGYYVLKYTDPPAVLIELEFISNPNGEKNLKDPNYQKKAAEGIAKGILKSLGL